MKVAMSRYAQFMAVATRPGQRFDERGYRARAGACQWERSFDAEATEDDPTFIPRPKHKSKRKGVLIFEQTAGPKSEPCVMPLEATTPSVAPAPPEGRPEEQVIAAGRGLSEPATGKIVYINRELNTDNSKQGMSRRDFFKLGSMLSSRAELRQNVQALADENPLMNALASSWVELERIFSAQNDIRRFLEEIHLLTYWISRVIAILRALPAPITVLGQQRPFLIVHTFHPPDVHPSMQPIALGRIA